MTRAVGAAGAALARRFVGGGFAADNKGLGRGDDVAAGRLRRGSSFTAMVLVQVLRLGRQRQPRAVEAVVAGVVVEKELRMVQVDGPRTLAGLDNRAPLEGQALEVAGGGVDVDIDVVDEVYRVGDFWSAFFGLF